MTRSRLAAAGLAGLLVLLLLFPVYWAVVSSLTPESRLFAVPALVPRQLVFDHYRALFATRSRLLAKSADPEAPERVERRIAEQPLRAPQDIAHEGHAQRGGRRRHDAHAARRHEARARRRVRQFQILSKELRPPI